MGVNRRANQFQYSLARELMTLRLKATIGASGAPTLVSTQSEGIASIARTGAGAYNVTLDDAYAQFVQLHGNIETASEANYLAFHLADENVASTKVISLVTHQAGTATDPQNGDVMWLTIHLRKVDGK